MVVHDEGFALASDLRRLEHLVQACTVEIGSASIAGSRPELTHAQWTALGGLSRREGINQKRLAALIKVGPIALVRFARSNGNPRLDRAAARAGGSTHRPVIPWN
jgi:hypothetical protein